ncbi:MAG: nucleotidyltransferase family protein [Gammaproteobacteria bacterium]|nr:nucleotidyltransferase family protein [Gammaproteobacteria bacterium]
MPETNSPIVGVLLAAGRGARFGGNKLLAPWRDDTVIAVATARHLIDALPDSVAVLRPGDEILASLLAAEGLRIVVNPNADDGMGGSLACGVAATEADGWVIALADMPAIRLETIAAVAQALAAGAPLAAPVYHGQRGHPIGFARRFRQDLMSLRGDRGGRDILARYGNELRQIDVNDPGVLYDVDRVADLVIAEH